MPMSGGSTAPGWYTDPWFPGGVRWFDGLQWTPHAGPAGPSDHYDAQKGRDTARWAGWAFLARGVALAVQVAAFPFAISRLFAAMEDPGPTPFGIDGFLAFASVAQLAGLVGMACLVGVCIWTFRATRNARALGLATSFEPGLAVAGWVIPLAQYVMPYLAVRDLFPEGHPGRRAVAWWWGSEIGAVVVGMAAVATAMAAGSGPGVVVGCAAACLALRAGFAGFQLTRRVLDVHEQLAEAIGAA